VRRRVGAFSESRIDAALTCLGADLVTLPGANKAKRHYLDGLLLPAEVLAELPAAAEARPPEPRRPDHLKGRPEVSRLDVEKLILGVTKELADHHGSELTEDEILAPSGGHLDRVRADHPALVAAAEAANVALATALRGARPPPRKEPPSDDHTDHTKTHEEPDRRLPRQSHHGPGSRRGAQPEPGREVAQIARTKDR
jgi:hypothetical protein